MRLLLTLILLLNLMIVSTAQISEVKISAGSNFFWWEFVTENIELTPDQIDQKAEQYSMQDGDYGWNTGYSFGIDFLPKWMLNTDLQYRKVRIKSFNPDGTQLSLTYLGLSEKLYFEAIPSFYISAGGYYNRILLLTSQSFYRPDLQRNVLASFDFGLTGGLSYRFKNIELYSDFYLGLNAQIDSPENFSPQFDTTKSKARSFTVGIAYIFDRKD